MNTAWSVTITRATTDETTTVMIDADRVVFSPHDGCLWVYAETDDGTELGKSREVGVFKDWSAAVAIPGEPDHVVDEPVRTEYKPGETIDPDQTPTAGTLMVDRNGGTWRSAGAYARNGRRWVLLAHLCRDLGPVIAAEDTEDTEDTEGDDAEGDALARRTVLYPEGLRMAEPGTRVEDRDRDVWRKMRDRTWAIWSTNSDESRHRIGAVASSDALYAGYGPIVAAPGQHLPF